MNEVVDTETPSSKEHLNYVFGISDRQDDYYLAKLASEAHILGIIHTTRAVFDVFAFLVNGVLLNGAIPKNKCDIRAVVKVLQPSPLKSELKTLIESYWFKYISAFINISKHRMLVKHSFHVGFQDSYTGIRVGAFDYNNQQYPRYKANELLKGVVEVKNKIVDCGQYLNNQVISRDA
ncbi:hypothetical protein [Marinobacterium aestuariivivens]|uniref:Uncharacterized protein n=1 Tax=Marinobacterium aestuariivivens TaxID=1698799 RepID=A0ABW2A114_9GAMM